MELKANDTMVVATIASAWGSAMPQGCRLTSSPISEMMSWQMMWKKGTASIIILPLPALKILPPRENTS